MNLIIATGIYPPDIGGPATYSKKIAEEFGKRGWNVIVMTYADKPLPPSESGHGNPPLPPKADRRGEGTSELGVCSVVRISRAHNVFARYFLYTLELVKLAKSTDLIYAQGPVSEGLPALIANKLTGKKYVLKVVGDPAWERQGAIKQKNKKAKKQIGVKTRPACAGRFIASKIGFIGLDEFQTMLRLPLKTKILKWIERLVARNADKIIVPSQYLKKIVMMWGVDADKIKVVYNAAGERIMNYELRIMNGGDAEEHNWQISKVEEGDIILSVGRLVAWKGFDTLIDLMPELLVVNPNFKLVIVGEGTEYDRLKFQISNFKFQKFEDKIILTCKLEHQELMDLMKKAKMFVLNSGYEGLSHSVIEAMQAGIPCAVSNVGGNPELVENEKTGLLFEYNNREQIEQAIIRLWQDNALREQVAAGGYEKIKKFSFERMIRETEDILTDEHGSETD